MLLSACHEFREALRTELRASWSYG
jgi:hypothetical protein